MSSPCDELTSCPLIYPVSNPKVSYRRLNQLQTGFPEGTPQFGPSVLKPDLKDRWSKLNESEVTIGNLIQFSKFVQKIVFSFHCQCVMSEPEYGPHPGPVSLQSAPLAEFLDNSSPETLSPAHLPAGTHTYKTCEIHSGSFLDFRSDCLASFL